MNALKNNILSGILKFKSSKNLTEIFFSHESLRLKNEELKMEGIADIFQISRAVKNNMNGYFVRGIIIIPDILTSGTFMGFYNPEKNEFEIQIKTRSSRAG
jgi:hypothetical protein